MDFLELSLRMADSRTDYLPYALYPGEWTDQEQELIHKWMMFNHPNKVWSTYNAWCFHRSSFSDGPRYCVKRVSYERFAWNTIDLEKLLHVVVLNSGKWTVELLRDTFPVREITPEEAMALPFAWYGDRPDRQREYYSTPRLRLLVELPYVTSMFVQYDEELFEQNTEANLPR